MCILGSEKERIFRQSLNSTRTSTRWDRNQQHGECILWHKRSHRWFFLTESVITLKNVDLLKQVLDTGVQGSLFCLWKASYRQLHVSDFPLVPGVLPFHSQKSDEPCWLWGSGRLRSWFLTLPCYIFHKGVQNWVQACLDRRTQPHRQHCTSQGAFPSPALW